MKNKVNQLLCFMLISLTFSCIRDPEEEPKEGLKKWKRKSKLIWQSILY